MNLIHFQVFFGSKQNVSFVTSEKIGIALCINTEVAVDVKV